MSKMKLSPQKEKEIREEMTKLFSHIADPVLLKKAIDDAIRAMKKQMKAELPTPKVEDPYGNPVNTGTKVAYNYQGQVRLGVVDKVVAVSRYGKTTDYSGEPYINIIINPLPTDHRPVSKSTVTNRMNLVVI